MHSSRMLNIIDYQGEAVPNTFLQQKAGASQVGILLPGAAYTCQMPFLYYLAQLLFK